MLSVLMFIGSVVFFVLGFQAWRYWLLVPILLIVGIGLNLLATNLALERGAREKQKQAQFTYRVTKIRLVTLRSEGVPLDVRRAMARLLNQEPLPEDKFLEQVAQDLSWERINRWREQILASTRVGSAPSVIAAKDPIKLPSKHQLNL
jgi:hypothetical protein